MIGPVCAESCDHESCWDIACPRLPGHAAVITVEAVTPALRLRHGLSPDARLAVVERYQGTEHVCCTDCEARQGVEAAARAWAEATGAAYDRTAA